jgi:PST family polysaccharide transporter
MPKAETRTENSASIQHRVLQNIVGLLSGRFLGLALAGVSSVLLARYLGSLGLGQYAALVAYMSLFSWLGSFGLDQIITREAARRREDAGSILMTGAVLGLIFATLTSIVALLVAPLAGYRGELRWLLVLIALDLLVLNPIKYPGIVFQVDLRQWYGVSIGLFRQVVWIGVVITCALTRASLFWVVAGRAFCGIVETTLYLIVSFQFFSKPVRFLYGEVRTLLAHSAPLAIVLLAGNIYHRVDQVLLHRLVNDQELGQYVSAVNLTEVLSTFPMALMASLFPILCHFSTDEPRFDQYVRLSFRYLNVVAFALCVVFTLGSRDIIRTLYGQPFARAAPMLGALVWSECGAFFGGVMSGALIARNLQGLTVAPNIAGAVFNLVLNLIFIPRWGGLGAAWATTISNAIAGVLVFLFFPAARRLVGLGLKAFLSAAAASVLALVAGTLSSGLPIGLELCIAGIVYLSVTGLTGLLGPDDVRRAWRLMGGKQAAGSYTG